MICCMDVGIVWLAHWRCSWKGLGWGYSGDTDIFSLHGFQHINIRFDENFVFCVSADVLRFLDYILQDPHSPAQAFGHILFSFLGHAMNVSLCANFAV